MLLASAIGWELAYTIALPVIFFTLVGRYLDRKISSDFVFTFLGGLLGIGSAVYLVWKKSERIKEMVYPTDNQRDKKDNLN